MLYRILGLYLLARLEFRSEDFSAINFGDNSEWFDIKLLVNKNADNNSNKKELKEMLIFFYH